MFDFANMMDVFFNGRPAAQTPLTPEKPKTKVTFEELFRRRSGVVRVEGKLYSFEFKEMEVIR